MFSALSIDFITVLTVQVRATLSLLVVGTAVFALHIISRHGSVPALAYASLVGCIFGVIALFIMVATQHDLLSSSEADPVSTFFTYLFVASSIQNSIRRMRNLDISRFGMESRLINGVYSVVSVSMAMTTVAAMCSYFAQQYSGIKQQYSMEEILQWSISIIGWVPTVMMTLSKQAYRGLTPKEEVKKPKSNRVRSIPLFLAMLIGCEIHGVLLLLYPPTNWKEMAGIVAVGLVIGTVYNQVAVPKLEFLYEPSFEHPVSEKLKLIDINI